MLANPNASGPEEPPVSPPAGGSSLPAHYTPRIAGYARGPFLDPQLITPSHWNWRNTRTAVVRHADGHDYRAIRVSSTTGEFLGWWAVELLGVPLTIFEE